MLSFFMLTSNTLYVQLGMYGKYVKQYGGVFLACAVAILFLMGLGTYQLVSPGGQHGQVTNCLLP